MNAPHPTRAAYGSLAKPVPADDFAASYARTHADGEIGAALSMALHASQALHMAAWHLDRAIGNGAGDTPDLTQLERVTASLRDSGLKMEATTSRLAGRLCQPASALAEIARAAGITLASDGRAA